MKIGVIFDIDDLGRDTYDLAAWSIVMSEFKFNPEYCGGTRFYSGDVDIEGNSRPYMFCIAIESLELSPIEHFKKVLMQSNREGLLSTRRRFIEGLVCDSLQCDGVIDARGRFLVENHQQWLITAAWKNGWRSFPSLDWLGWFAASYLVHTQPDYGDPWDDETVTAARRALEEAGQTYTLTTLDEYLDENDEKGLRSICKQRISVLNELWKRK